MFPPLFSRYRACQSFGTQVDNAYRPLPGGARFRTDLSATLFLSVPETYDGGACLIEDGASEPTVKLPAGSLVHYPDTSCTASNPRGAASACRRSSASRASFPTPDRVRSCRTSIFRSSPSAGCSGTPTPH
jgi:PKHD-type hydroxylase